MSKEDESLRAQQHNESQFERLEQMICDINNKTNLVEHFADLQESIIYIGGQYELFSKTEDHPRMVQALALKCKFLELQVQILQQANR